MALSREMVEQLLSKCTGPLESLLVLLVRDLDGRALEFETLVLSDFDRVSGYLRPQASALGTVKLGKDTMAAFQNVLAHRKDSEPGVFVNGNARRLTGPEITGVLGEVAGRAGLRFDGSKFAGADLGEAKSSRLVSKGATRDLYRVLLVR